MWLLFEFYLSTDIDNISRELYPHQAQLMQFQVVRYSNENFHHKVTIAV